MDGVDWDLGVDLDDDITYICEQCKRHTTQPSILKFEFCKKSLCNRCRSHGFCQNHFTMIPSNDIKKLKLKLKEKIENIFSFLCCFYLLLFIFELVIGWYPMEGDGTDYITEINRIIVGSSMILISLTFGGITLIFLIKNEKKQATLIKKIIQDLHKMKAKEE